MQLKLFHKKQIIFEIYITKKSKVNKKAFFNDTQRMMYSKMFLNFLVELKLNSFKANLFWKTGRLVYSILARVQN